MTLTLENIPRDVDAALQHKAKTEGKSVGVLAVELLRAALTEQPTKRRDLGDIAGTWIEDPEFDKIMREQDQVDPEMWK